MSIENDGPSTKIKNSVVETDQSSWGFVDIQEIQTNRVYKERE